jgi:hypothetical protein
VGNDHAALIKIGEQDDFASEFVRTTSLFSPQTIWDAIAGLLAVSYDTKPGSDQRFRVCA